MIRPSFARQRVAEDREKFLVKLVVCYRGVA